MAGTPSSPSLRRAKAEEQRARNFALIALLVVGVFGVVFVFVIVPFALRLAASSARVPGVTTQSDTLPPQRPVVQPLPDASNQKEQVVTGYTESKAKVALILDGQEIQQQVAGDDGGFSFSFSLVEGEHDIAVAASDEANNTSQSESNKIVIDVTKPTVKVTEPKDGATFSLPRERVLTVKGTMSEAGFVLVNGSRIATTGDSHDFTSTIQLGEGENTLTIRAEDVANNQSDETIIKVRYQP